jgi:WD40 repeat protein
VSTFTNRDGVWVKERDFQANEDPILMLELSKTEAWVMATVLKGFLLWEVKTGKQRHLKLPSGVRNISKRFGQSNGLVLSARDELAVAGIRQEILVWDMDSGDLVKRQMAHFQRIVEIKSLVTSTENSVLTSSIDRSIKVWNLDYIFEKEHHIDKHELTIDSVSISTSAQIAVVVTRSCIGIWDFMTGRLKFSLANTALGAIITHALVTDSGSHIVSAESGDLLYWDLNTREVVFQQHQENIQQIFFYRNQSRCVVISKTGTKGNHSGLVISRSVPEGDKHWEFSFTLSSFMKVVITSDEHYIICYDNDKIKPHLYIHSVKTGQLVDKVMVKYPGFKEVKTMVPLPDKPSQVAFIDVEKGNLMDISQRKFIKSIPFWDGTCSKDGRYGLYAPATGGMEMLDLRTGKVCKTLIPKVSEGIFDVMATFNATNEYVLYYHSGRKTIRAFRRKDGKLIANFRVQADLKGMETTTDGRSVVLGMGDGSMTTLTIADPEKQGIGDFVKALPSRNPGGTENAAGGAISYLQNGVEYPTPYDYSIYTDYLKALQLCIPPA